MSKILDDCKEKYGDKIPENELVDLVGDYEVVVRKRAELLFELIRMNSEGGESGLKVKDACIWSDALQNMLRLILQMLKTAEQPSQKLTEDFVRKIQKNLETVIQQQLKENL